MQEADNAEYVVLLRNTTVSVESIFYNLHQAGRNISFYVNTYKTESMIFYTRRGNFYVKW